MENWVHINELSGQGNKELIVTVDTNNSSEERQTQITGRTLNGITDILTIIQRGIENMDSIVLIKIVGDTDGVCYINGTHNSSYLPGDYVRELLNLLSGDSIKTPPVITCLVGDDEDFQIVPYKKIEKNGNHIEVYLEKYTFSISTDGSGYIETRVN